MRLILARILWGFDLELCGAEDGKDGREAWDKQKVYMLWEKGALMCRLRVRDDGVDKGSLAGEKSGMSEVEGEGERVSGEEQGM